MQRSLAFLARLSTCLLLLGSLLLTQAEDKKINPVGTWKWSFTGQNGQARETTMKIKMEGDKLTGTVSGRQQDTPIDELKVKADEITFHVTREVNGNKFTAKYSGKIDGDTIKGKIKMERDGQETARDLDAKREVEKAK